MVYVPLMSCESAAVVGLFATALNVLVVVTGTDRLPAVPPVVAGAVPSVVALIRAAGSELVMTTD